MPTSPPYQLNEIIYTVMIYDPMSILDIGIGFGKYGFLLREYLEFWNGNRNYKNWKKQIDGIEIFEEYITPLHNFIYNRIYVGNAVELLPELEKKYDLILLIDVIEHLNYENGLRLLEECKKRARNVLISTPRDIGTQKDEFNNQYETHIFQWKKKYFNRFTKKFFIPNIDSIIVFIGDDAPEVKKRCRNFLIKLRARQLFSYFVFTYRIFNKFIGK